jgi:hypothetical protein
METHAVSEQNSHKLDRIVQLLEGDGKDAPGLVNRLGTLESILYGKDKAGGLVQEHRIMWRVHVWLLCSASASLGFAAKWGLDKISNLKP